MINNLRKYDNTSPGKTVRIDLLLTVKPDEVNILHSTVVPLFTDVAGTVRLECTVPEYALITEVIPRPAMMGSYTLKPSISHNTAIPAPAQLNSAFAPTSAVTDTGASVMGIRLAVIEDQEKRNVNIIDIIEQG